MNCAKNTNGNFDSDILNLFVLIVGNDKPSLSQLEQLLIRGGVKNINTVHSEKDLSDTINNNEPDVIFIDDTIINGSFPSIINQINGIQTDPSVVILSNSKKMADYGIGFNSFPVISKPVNFSDLNKSISNLVKDRAITKLQSKLDRLFNNVCPHKLKFSTRKGHVFIDPDEIVYFKADSNYTHIFLKNNKQITVAKSLRHFDEGLKTSFFTRISRSVIININFLKELDRNNKSCILTFDDQKISLPITKNHIPPLLQSFSLC